MSKFKIHFQKMDSAIVLQILEQKLVKKDANPHDSTDRSWWGYFLMTTIDGIRVNIISSNLPQVTINFKGDDRNLVQKHYNKNYEPAKIRHLSEIKTIDFYIRGNRLNSNKDIIILPFNNNENRDEFYNFFLKIITKFKEQIG